MTTTNNTARQEAFCNSVLECISLKTLTDYELFFDTPTFNDWIDKLFLDDKYSIKQSAEIIERAINIYKPNF